MAEVVGKDGPQRVDHALADVDVFDLSRPDAGIMR